MARTQEEITTEGGLKYNWTYGWGRNNEKDVSIGGKTYTVVASDITAFGASVGQELLAKTIQKGQPLTKAEVDKIVPQPGLIGKDAAYDKFAWYQAILDKNSANLGFSSAVFLDDKGNSIDTVNPVALEKNMRTIQQTNDQLAQESAYDSYWNSLYSLEEGSLGKNILDNYADIEERAGQSNLQLAEAQYQQAALDQAAIVKSITDQVKTERMAKLRAGMNESQIANQDMQIMLNNMNALNAQTNALNQNRLAAQQQINSAQDTAYQQYLNTAMTLGQTGAAFTAADAGNAHQQALQYMARTGTTDYNKALQMVTKGTIS